MISDCLDYIKIELIFCVIDRMDETFSVFRLNQFFKKYVYQKTEIHFFSWCAMFFFILYFITELVCCLDLYNQFNFSVGKKTTFAPI